MRDAGKGENPRDVQSDIPEGFLIPHPASRIPLFLQCQLAQRRGETSYISAERLEEFLIGALDEMDELTREAATGGGRA